VALALVLQAALAELYRQSRRSFKPPPLGPLGALVSLV
jgi:hypothetical protein